jgi:integrase
VPTRGRRGRGGEAAHLVGGDRVGPYRVAADGRMSIVGYRRTAGTPRQSCPITLQALTSQWQRDRAKAALVVPCVAEIRWHDLRGTFGSCLLRKTRNLACGPEGGHASINTTMRHYAHVLNDDVRQA